MKSIQNQYRDLKEGRMSQANFMRNLRMTMPQFVTNVTSFDDAVKILKNKSILTENVNMDKKEEAINEELEQIDPNDVYSGSSVDRGETGSRIEFRVVKNTPEYFTIDYKIIPNSRFVSRGASRSYERRVEEGSKVIYKDQVNPAQKDYIKVDGTSFQINNSQLVKMLYSNVAEAEELNEGKGKDLNPNQIHPQELRMGIKVELEHTDDLDKAKKIALDHLAENPYYYTALKLSGIESPSAPKVKTPVEKKDKKKKEAVELVDKANAMQKVKMPKADEKKKLKEARYNIDGEPNAAAKQAMQFVDGNSTLKALSDDIEIQQSQDDAILRFGYWEALPANAVEKLKLQFDVEVMDDYDEDTGSIIAYRLTPLRRNYDNRDLGASFKKFKSQLEEVVREVLAEMQSDEQETDTIAMSMDETFDGRDNLDAENEY